MAILKLESICKNYFNASKSRKERKAKADSYAVKNLSFETKDGEFVGILGPSGCGKSTTLRMIAGLEDITDGNMYIDDQRVNDLPPRERNIGLAFEDYALYPPLSVYDNLAFNLRAKKKSVIEIQEAIQYVAPLMQVTDLLDTKPTALSGGQKQRVNIARAIVRRPRLLLLDEPLSHLDGKMRQTLRHEIKRMHNEIQCTTIIVTHDQLEAMSMADRIVIMKDGELQQIGSPQEVYDNPVNKFVAGFIGEPPMNIFSITIIKTEKGFAFSFDGSTLKVDVPQIYESKVADGMRLDLGIRPTDIIIQSSKNEPSDITVTIFENLGDENRIGIRIGETLMNITSTSQTQYKVGEPVRLNFVAERTHLFDPTTGERI